MNRTVCPAAVELIKSFESLQLKAYHCPAGVPTIGWGHTGPDVTEQDVKNGRTITIDQAEKIFQHDLQNAASGVQHAVTAQVTDNQFGALVSFTFNLGIGNLRQSTLLRMVNKGQKALAADQFGRWTYAGGIRLHGLEVRREAERQLYLTPDSQYPAASDEGE